MTLTIELPDNLEAALKAHANAQGVSEAGYVRTLLELNLADSPATPSLSKENSATARPRKNLAQFLMESPFAGSDLYLERQQDYGRPIEL
jgi:hypothetical protein